jgi:hypothetical protein
MGRNVEEIILRITGESESGERALTSIKNLMNKLQPLGFALAGAGAAGGALVRSFTMAAARSQELGIVLQTVGRTAGYTQGQISAYEQGVRGMGIQTQSARQALVQMAEAEIDWAQATDLARLAQDAAVIAQLDSSASFQRLITVIQTGQTEMARTMGLTVNFSQAYEQLADSLGISVDALSEQQKTQARVNEVMRAGEGIAGTYDAAMTTAGKNLRSMNRYWLDAKEALGQAYLPALGRAVEIGTDLLKSFNKLDPAQQQQIANWLGIGTVVSSVTGGLILLTPRIIRMGESLLVVYGVAKNAAVGLQLVAAGEKTTEVASLGLGAALGAVVIPLTALAAAGGLFVLAVTKSREITVALREQDSQLQQTAATYEDYATGMMQVIEESGRYHEQIARMQAAGLGQVEIFERLIHLTGGLTEAEWQAAQATGGWTSAIEQTRDRLGTLPPVVDAATSSTVMFGEAALGIDAAVAALTDALAGPFRTEAETFNQQQIELRDRAAELRSKIGEIERARYTTPEQREQMAGWVQDLQNVHTEMSNLGTAHRAAMNQIIYDMLMARLSVDGWTADEQQLALETARDMGLIDEATYNASVAMNDALLNFADGAGVEETKGAILSLPGLIDQAQTAAALGMDAIAGYFATAGGAAGAAAGQVQNLADRIAAVPTHIRIEFETVYTGPNPSQVFDPFIPHSTPPLAVGLLEVARAADEMARSVGKAMGGGLSVPVLALAGAGTISQIIQGGITQNFPNVRDARDSDEIARALQKRALQAAMTGRARGGR